MSQTLSLLNNGRLSVCNLSFLPESVSQRRSRYRHVLPHSPPHSRIVPRQLQTALSTTWRLEMDLPATTVSSS
ncbi:hypothetical protein J6590_077281 [Homalodisca vitripennis]|nr:hypothetical protein J6590_077281 [Homalodisca vitripennis]